MLPVIQKPLITPRQKVAALAVAGIADILQIALPLAFVEGGASPFDDALDMIVATVLIAICGFRWQFMLAFFMEIIPGLDLFPTWTALALTLQTIPQQSSAGETLAPAPAAAAPHAPIQVTAVAIPPVQPPPVQPQS